MITISPKSHSLWHVSLVIFLLLCTLTQSSIYSIPSCSSTQILNTKTLACDQCPANMQPNPNQEIPNECLCKKGYYFSTSDTKCVQYNNVNSCATNEFINAFGVDGSALTVNGCTTCDATAYQNMNGTACTPCMTGMTYSATNKKCQCIDSSTVETALGCFPQSYTTVLGLTLTSSVYSSKLKYLVPGCYYFKNPLSCSQLVNLCVYSLLSSTPECEFFKKANLTNYLYSQTSDVYKLATLSKSTQMKMKLVYYLPQGNYVKQKDLKLADIMRCGMPSNTETALSIGSNIDFTCEFNFNNLLAQMAGKNHQSYVYQLLLQGDNNKYYEVNTFLNGNSQPVKRFFLEDTFTSSTSINVLTTMKLQLTLTTEGVLSGPSLYLSYTKLSLQPGTGITPTTQRTQSISYTIQFTSELAGFWSVVLPIFIVVNLLVLVHTAAKTYISYLNRKTPFLFFLHFIDMWSLWMFYFLLIITGYWFVFTKTTSNIYTFISHQSMLYVAFYIVFGLMVAFRLVSVIIEKSDKLKIQVFLINRQKDRLVNNSFRQIFIVNSLANFCTYRTFSVFWIMLIMLFFVTGLKWEQHAREVVNTTLDQIEYFHKKNSIYLYFLSSSILLVIAIVFKVLRRLSVLFWPYPFEDFVDYCSVANISLFFMKKRSPQAYYINAGLSQNTQVTFKELNQAVRRGLLKNRSLSINLNQPNRLKLSITYINRDLQDRFKEVNFYHKTKLLRRQQDQDHNRHMKYSIGSNVALKPQSSTSKNSFSFRQDFIEKRIKPALQQMVQRGSEQKKQAYQSFFHIPPVDLRNQRSLNETKFFIDDNLDIVKEVFPNGDEFEELHTIIILYLLWIVVTGSSPVAAFLTYFCDQWIFNAWIGSTYRKNLQKMTRVKEGFML